MPDTTTLYSADGSQAYEVNNSALSYPVVTDAGEYAGVLGSARGAANVPKEGMDRIVQSEIVKGLQENRADRKWARAKDVIGTVEGIFKDFIGWWAASENFSIQREIVGIERDSMTKSYALQSKMVTAQKDIADKQMDTQVEIAKTNAHKDIKIAQTKADAKVEIEKDKNLYKMFYPRNEYYYGIA